MNTNNVHFGSFLHRALSTVAMVALTGAVTISLTKTAEGTAPCMPRRPPARD